MTVKSFEIGSLYVLADRRVILYRNDNSGVRVSRGTKGMSYELIGIDYQLPTGEKVARISVISPIQGIYLADQAELMQYSSLAHLNIGIRPNENSNVMPETRTSLPVLERLIKRIESL